MHISVAAGTAGTSTQLLMLHTSTHIHITHTQALQAISGSTTTILCYHALCADMLPTTRCSSEVFTYTYTYTQLCNVFCSRSFADKHDDDDDDVASQVKVHARADCAPNECGRRARVVVVSLMAWHLYVLLG